MGALYRVAAVLRLASSARARRALAPALALALACAGAAAPAEEAPAPEVLVEVLPRSAEVTLDGRPLARGGGAAPAPEPGRHVLAVAAEGYEPVERTLAEEDLAGVRVAEALRPLGFAAPRALDYDDAEGLALAAAFLARRGTARDAVDYAERALVLDRGVALAHRALGDAAAREGDRRRAVAAWTEYLRLAPGAPDAAEVAARVDGASEAAAR
jgi:hypothetical protein